MNRTQKAELVASLNQTFQDAGLVVVTHQTGLTVAEITDLRRKMREAGASFKVTKNRLTKLALDGTPYAPLADHFRGPTAVAFSSDPVSAARVTVEFAKKHDGLSIVVGAMGDQALDEAEVKALAALPSLDELRGKIVGLLQTPASRVASVLAAPAGQLARVFGAYAERG